MLPSLMKVIEPCHSSALPSIVMRRSRGLLSSLAGPQPPIGRSKQAAIGSSRPRDFGSSLGTEWSLTAGPAPGGEDEESARPGSGPDVSETSAASGWCHPDRG